MATKKIDATAEYVTTPKFAKNQILKAQIFADKVDMLNAILDDNDTLTVDEVQAKIDEFMKGKVM